MHQHLRACHCRVDTLAVSPAAFVGRELRLLWPDDDAWFLGSAADFDAASGMHKVELPSPGSAPGLLSTCRHQRLTTSINNVPFSSRHHVQVVYADGEVSDELLCGERLRLRMPPGATLPPPSVAEASAMVIALQVDPL